MPLAKMHCAGSVKDNILKNCYSDLQIKSFQADVSIALK